MKKRHHAEISKLFSQLKPIDRPMRIGYAVPPLPRFPSAGERKKTGQTYQDTHKAYGQFFCGPTDETFLKTALRRIKR